MQHTYNDGGEEEQRYYTGGLSQTHLRQTQY